MRSFWKWYERRQEKRWVRIVDRHALAYHQFTDNDRRIMRQYGILL